MEILKRNYLNYTLGDLPNTYFKPLMAISLWSRFILHKSVLKDITKLACKLVSDPIDPNPKLRKCDKSTSIESGTRENYWYTNLP